MFVVIIQKYGIVFKSVMFEIYNSLKLVEINSIFNLKLCKDVVELCELVVVGISDDVI